MLELSSVLFFGCFHSNKYTVAERYIPTHLCYVQNVSTHFRVLVCTAQIMGGALLLCLAILIPRPKSKIRECYSMQKWDMCIEMYRITVDYFLFLHNSQYDQDTRDQKWEFWSIFDFFCPPRLNNCFCFILRYRTHGLQYEPIVYYANF